MSDVRYFNFPIQLLNGFLVDSRKVLDDVSDYAIYAYSICSEHEDEKERIKESAEYFNIQPGIMSKTLKNGQGLYNSTPGDSPMVGLNLSIFWDYFNNYKCEYDKICLLGFLAIKSIVQQKPYSKIDNEFWFARMDGEAKSCERDSLSPEIKKYFNHYQARKIKSELQNGWGLITYSRYMRGFYVSFKLTLTELVYEAEKRRKSTKEKNRKEEEKIALRDALNKLRLSQPWHNHNTTYKKGIN